MTANLADPADVLARTIWGEARSEDRAGMAAVAAVAQNRAAHPRWWGHDVLSVCLAPWQFSCWNEGDPNRDKLLAVTGADPQFLMAVEIADEVMQGKLHDPTNGADSYYADTMEEPPSWAAGKEPCAVIGHHRFYRLELPAPPPAPVMVAAPAPAVVVPSAAPMAARVTLLQRIKRLMMNFNIASFFSQATNGIGLSTLIGTGTAVATGQMNLHTAVPVVAGAIAAILFPENSAAPDTVQKAVVDVEALTPLLKEMFQHTVTVTSQVVQATQAAQGAKPPG